jgi:D-psicose/D-tagatose/L-ribulose 3-epimerase
MDCGRQRNTLRAAVEPLNRFETDFCNTTRQAVALCALVDHPCLGVMLDTFHMKMDDDDLPQAIRQAGALLIYFQANENHRGFLGTGHLDWTGISRALAEIDYQGAIKPEPFRRMGHLLSMLLARWLPPTHDEDADLRASGDLLRGAPHAVQRE